MIEILYIVVVFVGILLLAYFVTRFAAKKATGHYKSRHLEIVDSLSVGVDAQFLIVKAGGEYFLASKSQKNISLLTKLEQTDEFENVRAEKPPGFAESFRAVLEGKLSRAGAKQDKPCDPADAACLAGAADPVGAAGSAGSIGAAGSAGRTNPAGLSGSVSAEDLAGGDRA